MSLSVFIYFYIFLYLYSIEFLAYRLAFIRGFRYCSKDLCTGFWFMVLRLAASNMRG